MTARDRYPATLLALFGVWFVVLGIAPHYRQDWLLENLLVFLIVPLLIGTFRRLRFSNLAYTGILASGASPSARLHELARGAL